jgi:predicted acylesterase/phospholipase RssA
MHEPIPGEAVTTPRCKREIRNARDRHLFGPGPKRILAIDGGGARGVIALKFLEKIESLLRARTGNAELRLSDYFDLIGGTSTGAIIAAGLALGLPVEHLLDVYQKLATNGFQRSPWLLLGGVLAPKFKVAPLSQVIEEHVGEETLGSGRLLTGLAIVAKRIDSESVWVFHNNPDGKYYAADDPAQEHKATRNMPLKNLIRASTAAPSYFTPEHIVVAHSKQGVPVAGTFVDGGVSPHNNPALLMFTLATISGYAFDWTVGADKLMLVSVGNGAAGDPPTHEQVPAMPSAQLAIKSLMSIIQDCSQLNQTLLQWMARCPTPWHMDGEIGNLGNDQLGREPLLHYVRYDVELKLPWLHAHDLPYSADKLKQIRQFDRPDLVADWIEIGLRAAKNQVDATHFPTMFDPVSTSLYARAAHG